MSEPFAKVYKTVGRCRKLTLSAKALVIEIMLLRVENGYENDFPIVRRRTEATLGFGHSQLERAIRNLMENGFIVEVSRGLYRATSLLLDGVDSETGLHNPGEGEDYILCKVSKPANGDRLSGKTSKKKTTPPFSVVSLPRTSSEQDSD